MQIDALRMRNTLNLSRSQFPTHNSGDQGVIIDARGQYKTPLEHAKTRRESLQQVSKNSPAN